MAEKGYTKGEKSKELLEQERKDFQKLAEEKARLKLPVKTQIPITKELPSQFKFWGTGEYGKAIQKFMAAPVLTSPLEVPFKDVAPSRKTRGKPFKFQPFTTGTVGYGPLIETGVKSINPNAVPIGMHGTFVRLEMIPLLTFYSPERLLSTTYQEAYKLLHKLERNVASGKIIKLPTNIKFGNTIIPQFFYANQKTEIAKAKATINQAIINVFNEQERKSSVKSPIPHSIADISKEVKQIESTAKPEKIKVIKGKIVEEKKKETKKEKPKKTKKVKISRKKQSLIKSQQTLASLFKAADSLAKPKLGGGSVSGEKPSRVKKFMGTGARAAATIPGGGPKSAMQLMLQMHDPFSTGLPYMKEGGRVPSKKRKPYAIGGKVYSQAIRKPKLI